MFQSYKKYWKGYVDFSGVTSRKDFWLSVLANWIILMILSVIGAALAAVESSASASALSILSFLILIFSLANLLPALAIMVRRLRDAGLGWGHIFWLFLPFFGAIILLVLFCKPTAAPAARGGYQAYPGQYEAGANGYYPQQQAMGQPFAPTAGQSFAPVAGQPMPSRSAGAYQGAGTPPVAFGGPQPAAFGQQPAAQPVNRQTGGSSEPSLEPDPGRALWVAAGLILLPFVSYLIHCLPRLWLIYCAPFFSFAATGLLGVCVYLLLQKGTKWKVLGAVSAVLAIFLFHVGDLVTQMNSMRGGLFSLRLLYEFLFLRPVRSSVLLYVIKAVLAAGGALFFGALLKTSPPKKQVWLTSLCTSVVVLVFNLIYVGARGGGRTLFSMSLSIISGTLLAVMLLLTPPALFALCTMKSKTIRLSGWGKAWCWLCLLGMLGATVMCILTIARVMSSRMYSTQLILSVVALVGFIMLLAKKRAGWYVILFTAFTILISQFASSFNAVIQGASAYSSLMVGALAGSLNPLITWLSIRSGLKAGSSAPVAAPAYSGAAMMPAGQAASFTSQPAMSFAPQQNAQPVRTAPQPAAANTMSVQQYVQLADQYAHIESLFGENPEKKNLEAKLVAGGANAQAGITRFLILCGSGSVKYGWWNGAASLTTMLRKIGGSAAEEDLKRLKNLNTNIWEYHTQVKDTAEKELLALKKESGGYGADGRIPPEYAYAELLRLQNIGSPEKRLEEFFAMQDSADAWSQKDRAFYYFIAGGAARVLYPYNKSNLAFYAAQVNISPVPTSMGWQHLKEAEGNTLPTTPESARQMHEKYPLPHSMEEARTYMM